MLVQNTAGTIEGQVRGRSLGELRHPASSGASFCPMTVASTPGRRLFSRVTRALQCGGVPAVLWSEILWSITDKTRLAQDGLDAFYPTRPGGPQHSAVCFAHSDFLPFMVVRGVCPGKRHRLAQARCPWVLSWVEFGRQRACTFRPGLLVLWLHRGGQRCLQRAC